MPRLAALAVVLALATAARGDPPSPPLVAPWPFDELTLANGAKFQGRIVEETKAGTTFQIVKRPPGRPTVAFTTYFAAKEILGVKRLGEADRAALRDRLAELDPDGGGERRRMDAIEFTPVEWLGRKDGAKRYEADQFVLVSAAQDEVTRRAAVRLEQIYTAFARVLPPRRPAARPTLVELAGDPEQYKAALKASGLDVLNAAVFLPADNRVVCGSDLRRLGDDLARARLHHVQQLAAADAAEKDLRELYKGHKADLERFLGAIQKERQKVIAADRGNDRAFDAATRKLFAVLYHEAFHSYAAAFAYPPLPADDVRAGKGTGELPRWLNEGLAQLFEDPVIEAGELRIGHADADRLKRVQDALSGKAREPDAGLLPLADLLKAGRDSFLAAHGKARPAADRTYLTAWAVAHYLAFERRLVGTAAFDKYLVAVNGGGDPAAAFAALVGQEVPAFEKDWHEYLRKLTPDGTVRR